MVDRASRTRIGIQVRERRGRADSCSPRCVESKATAAVFVLRIRRFHDRARLWPKRYVSMKLQSRLVPTIINSRLIEWNVEKVIVKGDNTYFLSSSRSFSRLWFLSVLQAIINLFTKYIFVLFGFYFTILCFIVTLRVRSEFYTNSSYSNILKYFIKYQMRDVMSFSLHDSVEIITIEI